MIDACGQTFLNHVKHEYQNAATDSQRNFCQEGFFLFDEKFCIRHFTEHCAVTVTHDVPTQDLGTRSWNFDGYQEAKGGGFSIEKCVKNCFLEMMQNPKCQQFLLHCQNSMDMEEFAPDIISLCPSFPSIINVDFASTHQHIPEIVMCLYKDVLVAGTRLKNETPFFLQHAAQIQGKSSDESDDDSDDESTNKTRTKNETIGLNKENSDDGTSLTTPPKTQFKGGATNERSNVEKPVKRRDTNAPVQDRPGNDTWKHERVPIIQDELVEKMVSTYIFLCSKDSC